MDLTMYSLLEILYFWNEAFLWGVAKQPAAGVTARMAPVLAAPPSLIDPTLVVRWSCVCHVGPTLTWCLVRVAEPGNNPGGIDVTIPVVSLAYNAQLPPHLFENNPVNTKHLYNICTSLGQRRRRWADAVQMLYTCFEFAGTAVSLKREERIDFARHYLMFWIIYSYYP